MDINAIWAPRALQALGEISALWVNRLLDEQIAAFSPRVGAAPLAQFIGDTVFFQRAIQNWRGASRHFVVTLGPEAIRNEVQQKLQWLQRKNVFTGRAS